MGAEGPRRAGVLKRGDVGRVPGSRPGLGERAARPEPSCCRAAPGPSESRWARPIRAGSGLPARPAAGWGLLSRAPEGTCLAKHEWFRKHSGAAARIGPLPRLEVLGDVCVRSGVAAGAVSAAVPGWGAHGVGWVPTGSAGLRTVSPRRV